MEYLKKKFSVYFNSDKYNENYDRIFNRNKKDYTDKLCPFNCPHLTIIDISKGYCKKFKVSLEEPVDILKNINTFVRYKKCNLKF